MNTFDGYIFFCGVYELKPCHAQSLRAYYEHKRTGKEPEVGK